MAAINNPPVAVPTPVAHTDTTTYATIKPKDPKVTH